MYSCSLPCCPCMWSPQCTVILQRHPCPHRALPLASKDTAPACLFASSISHRATHLRARIHTKPEGAKQDWGNIANAISAESMPWVASVFPASLRKASAGSWQGAHVMIIFVTVSPRSKAYSTGWKMSPRSGSCTEANGVMSEEESVYISLMDPNVPPGPARSTLPNHTNAMLKDSSAVQLFTSDACTLLSLSRTNPVMCVEHAHAGRRMGKGH